jgi:hypothetical protein
VAAGAINIMDASLHVSKSRFERNYSPFGAALVDYSTTASTTHLLDSVFVHNGLTLKPSPDGWTFKAGAIAMKCPSVQCQMWLRRVQVLNNKAEEGAGILQETGRSLLDIRDCTISNNAAFLRWGGGSFAARLAMSGTTWQGNRCSGNAGGMAVMGSLVYHGQADLHSVRFLNNSASGGIGGGHRSPTSTRRVPLLTLAWQACTSGPTPTCPVWGVLSRTTPP